MAGLTAEQIKAQSEGTLRQWRPTWERHAKIAASRPMHSIGKFEGTGAGRACLLIGNGASFEREIDTIRAHQDKVDIMVCDKALGACLDNGITPQFCIVADAAVSFEKYCEPWKDKLKNTILFSSVCANPKWAEADWGEVYYYCVKDAIGSEKIFQEISGCPNLIAAATNVSNLMLVFLTQCDNEGRRNFFGYDKYLLIGYDYSWRWDGAYYAFDYSGGNKRNYMRHNYGRTLGGEYCFTSNNLGFSLRWLEQYVTAYKLPVVQCSPDSVFPTPVVSGGWAPLAKQMQYEGSLNGPRFAGAVQKLRELSEERRRLIAEIQADRRRQYLDFAATV